MYLPPARQSEIAVELARHVRQEFESRAHRFSRPDGIDRLRQGVGRVGGLIENASAVQLRDAQSHHMPSARARGRGTSAARGR
jgi:hypothetical protein